MTIPQPPIQVELFARQVEVLLGDAEAEVRDQLRPLIDDLMARLLEEAEGGITDERLDQLTAPLNQAIENLLAQAMFNLQDPLRTQAATVGPVVTTAPFLTPDTLMKRAVMDGESITTWLRRRSPSRWQRGLIDIIRTGLQDGLQEAVNTVRQGVQRLTDTVVETALWSFGNQQLTLNWQEPERWLYVAVLDPLTCPICAPWANRTTKTLAQMPDVPRHPRCRCSVFPLFADEVPV